MNLLSSYRRAQSFIMGASDSKIAFKQGIFKLSERTTIPVDGSYWRGVSSWTSKIDPIKLTVFSSGSSLSRQKMYSAFFQRLTLDGPGTLHFQISKL